ncbi:acetolactate decarboxylase [Listeria riparia]|uniref:Alpha-acetolactate decarboxylase n=1 Tax=Listeria riparia FSL S10-1204 TaxID=1265816 RepID=W7D4W2_9LIST|nr:acetolactate decarboxylase [Listeria riparia]EUJ44247.1 alpha-acetolactate decarboxylase [Listeria riparia FSL S10-1204]
MTDSSKNRLFQHATLAALLGGLYGGSTTFKELLTHGDLGIGTLDSLDGELVILDGVAYQIRADGEAYRMEESDTTPYAMVTFFEADFKFDVNQLMTKEALETRIASLTQGPNLFYSVKMTGNFRIVHTRTVQKQSRPFLPLMEISNDQCTYELEYITGTIVGFWSPTYLQGVYVPGYHLHFIDDLRKVGGHVFDYEILEGRIEISRQTGIEIELPQNTDYLKSNLENPEIDTQIESIEKDD